MPPQYKRISNIEKEFIEFIVFKEASPVEAAKKVFHWRCEPRSSEQKRAKDLANTKRCKEYREKLEKQLDRDKAYERLTQNVNAINWDDLRKFAFDRLAALRDDENASAKVRFNAIEALEKLADPASDVNLIFLWMDLLWRSIQAHCCSCHTTFPLWKVKNEQLLQWQKRVGAEPIKEVENLLERRLELILRSDSRKTPHPSQVLALSAPERHLAGLGPARGGKSLLLAWFALLTLFIPGVEIWILARIYRDASAEVDYLESFLNSLFYPYTKHFISKTFDTKTEELTITTKWGSTLKVRSAKAKGSITGRELEMALVAEPGWVPDDVYDHLRARMSSRLGRIIMLGTPQGFGGILGRFVNMTGRDPKTNKVIRLSPEQRTIANGAPWGISLLKFQMQPGDNPEYVQSELDAARMELTDSEYAAEFQGLMASTEGAIFPHIKIRHLTKIPIDFYERAVWILGVDQGPKNFAACLIGFDGKRIVVPKEYFVIDFRTMKSHMVDLRKLIPMWIKQKGGDPDMWKMTIFDAEPSLRNEIAEFEAANSPWPTEHMERPVNRLGSINKTNWRKETYEYINVMAAEDNLFFDIQDEDIHLLHGQLMQAQAMPENRDLEGDGMGKKKGWIVGDKWRGDHVMDSFTLGMYAIMSGYLLIPDGPTPSPKDAFSEQLAAFDFLRAKDEMGELKGFPGYEKGINEDELFERKFGRPRKSMPKAGYKSYYSDY